MFQVTSIFVHAISHLAHEHIYKILYIISMQDNEHNASNIRTV